MLFLLLVCQPQPISAHDEESLPSIEANSSMVWKILGVTCGSQ